MISLTNIKCPLTHGVEDLVEHDTPLVAALAQVDDLAGPATLGSLLPDVGPAASGWVLGVTDNCEDEVGAREVGINRPRIIMLCMCMYDRISLHKVDTRDLFLDVM